MGFGFVLILAERIQVSENVGESSTVSGTAMRMARILFSFPVALSVLLALLVVLSGRNRFTDPDMWWHLKTGEIIWNTHHIPTVDPFSYTVAGRPWIAQEWLSQLTIYMAYHFGGYGGMMLWMCVAGSALVIAGYGLCWLYAGNGKVAFLGALIIWLFSTVGLTVRPHLPGYLLLIFELLILQLGRMRDKRWFYALPLLFCLWINVHSSFFLGLIVLATTLGSTLKPFKVGLMVGEDIGTVKRKSLVVAAAASIGAIFVNPIGPRLIVYPLDVMLNQHLNLGFVTEWQQPQFDNLRSLSLLGLAALILLIPLLRRIESRLEELAFLALGFGFAVLHERMLFVFGILVAPIFCRLLADTWETYDFRKDRILPNAMLILIAALLAILAFPNTARLTEQMDKSNPVGALNFIRHSGLAGRMLNDYVSGGYLIWAAPERKVFIDGRADLYDPAGVMAEYGRWALLQEDTAELLKRWDVQYCLLQRNAPVTRSLRLLGGWKQVYSDRLSVVFARVP